MNSIIIKKNSPLPNVETSTFFTTHEGQERVSIKITQGEGDDPDFVDVIDEIVLQLPSNRPISQPLDVTYSYDENQIMHCKVTDVNSGRTEEKKVDLGKSTGSSNPLDDFLVH
jgi:molecular chaperone DnaK